MGSALDGRNAIVVGSGSGIGYGSARLLARDGAGAADRADLAE